MKGVSNVMKRALMSAPVRVAFLTACSALVAALKTCSYGRLYWKGVFNCLCIRLLFERIDA